MACEIGDYKRVMLVLWGKPELSDFDRIVSRLDAVYAALGPVVFIGRVPKAAAPPDEKMRKAISRILPQILRHCSSYHAVFEGVGFGSSAKRAVLSTMFLMSAERKQYHVHSTAFEVAGAVPLAMQSEVVAALEYFRREGRLDHNLESMPPVAPSGRFGTRGFTVEAPSRVAGRR